MAADAAAGMVIEPVSRIDHSRLLQTYLHHEGVVHRDLATRNVLLDTQMRARITDFGRKTRRSLSLFLSLSLSLSLSLLLSRSLVFSRSLSLCLSISRPLSLSLSVSRSLGVCSLLSCYIVSLAFSGCRSRIGCYPA